MSDELKTPFVFVPDGSPAPDAVRGPNGIRVPATFVPRGGGRLTPSGQPWPRDRTGREWPKDRLGRPVCPLWDLYPGVRAPGEAAPESGDPVAAFLAMDAVFRDPAAAAGLLQTAAASGRGESPGAGDNAPTGPAVPDKQWAATARPGTQPVYDIYVGGAWDESESHNVLGYADRNHNQAGHNTEYFPWNTDEHALARYIDSLPANALINLIGHSLGGDTAAKAAALARHPINLLVTVDPVSGDRPDKAAVEAHVGHWINVEAVTGGAITRGNILAFIGQAWGELPKGTADVFIRAAANHEDFAKMMITAGSDGITPQQALERAWPR